LSDLKGKLKAQNIINNQDIYSISSRYIFAVLDEDNTIIEWSFSPVFNQNKIIDNYFRPGETYFISNSLVDYLSIYDTVKISSYTYKVVLFEPLEKNYQIQNKYYSLLSLTEHYNRKFNTNFEINYFREAVLSRDGRKHSLPILNNNNNKIGVVTFFKPTRETELQNISYNFDFTQSVLTVVLFFLIGLLILKNSITIKSRFTKFIIFAFYLLIFRYLILYLNITALTTSWGISNSKYFSSLFGNGIAGSPVELFISLIAFSVIVFLAFSYALDYFHNYNDRDSSWFTFTATSLTFTLVFILSLRGLGASVKSVVVDSSLRYYRESSLIPSGIESFMLFNVLLLGLIAFVGTVAFLLIIYTNVPNNRGRLNYFVGLFFFVQLAALVFDLIQREPQGTPFIRVLFILFTFIALLMIDKKQNWRFTNIFVYSVASSIIVILLLTQYNSLAERTSLKNTAYNLTRQNEDLLKFAVQETLVRAITDRETVQSFYFDNKNASSMAFKLWSNSILQKESLGSSVSLLDYNHNKIGSFDFRFIKEYEIDWDKYSIELSDLHEIKIFEESILYSDNKLIRGIASVEDVEGVLGYVTVSVIYDLSSLGVFDAPEFIVSDASYINDSIDFSKLKIFDFHQGTLINSISNYNLGENEIISILDAPFNQYGEAWIKFEINNEDHLVFILKREREGISRVIVIALQEKDLSWGLFDFFKIFFVHILFILIAFTIYFSVFLFKYRKIKLSFAVKLLLSFILISLIPLILVSFFFRNITSEKNEYAIEYKLEKRAVSISNYLENYSVKSSLNLNTAADKAKNDLGVDFTLFRGSRYILSTQNQFYDVGLIPKIVNPVAYQRLFSHGLTEAIVKEKIENYSFNSFYYKTSLFGEYYVIKVTDGFNKIMLPLSGEEVDVYIFISYSVAMVIILILGFVLTNQFSKPIESLKNATRSVASGDLNVEVKATSKDEVGELVKGFNYMVKELKRSQAEIAEFERETAWKEMAKQVAHEIKNPLTPMKLSVQQLIASYNDKSPKFDQLFGKVTNTIINQIETLKNIASEFSSFARMPNPKLEFVNIKEIISDSINLFDDERITIDVSGNDYNIEADRDQLKRVFINLIRNSIQADADNIKIKIEQENELLYIIIKDNGKGIKTEDVDKIFEVNFSTKQYGMGIGLSMAKKTIENIGGEITLKETNNEGTIFQIKLPLV